MLPPDDMNRQSIQEHSSTARYDVPFQLQIGRSAIQRIDWLIRILQRQRVLERQHLSLRQSHQFDCIREMSDGTSVQAFRESFVAALLFLFSFDVILLLGFGVVWIDRWNMACPLVPEIHELRQSTSVYLEILFPSRHTRCSSSCSSSGLGLQASVSRVVNSFSQDVSEARSD